MKRALAVFAMVALLSGYVQANDLVCKPALPVTIHTIADRILSAIDNNLAVDGKGYARIEVNDYITAQESQYVLERLIARQPTGTLHLSNAADVQYLQDTVGLPLTQKILAVLEVGRAKATALYSHEVGHPFEVMLSQLRWTDGSYSLPYADRWHYDGYWFNEAITFFGTGTETPLDEQIHAKFWPQGYTPTLVVDKFVSEPTRLFAVQSWN